MYWTVHDRDDARINYLWSGHMDGTNKTLMLDRGELHRVVIDLQVDTTSRLLFWAEQVELLEDTYVWEIVRSDLDGENVKRTVALQRKSLRIRIGGNRLF